MLGISRGAARAAIEARLANDPALQTKVKLWQDNFAALDLAAAPELPPEGLFDKIAAGIDADLREVPGTLTRRAGSGDWTEMAPGVTLHGAVRGSDRQAALDSRARLARCNL